VLAPTALGRAVQHLGTPLSRLCCRGCRWDRDTEAALMSAGFVATDVRRERVAIRPFGTSPVLLFDGRAA
jgi:hypothetical protein